MFIQLMTRLALARRGIRYKDHLARRRDRGMDSYHDMHDWLGGWPYEPVAYMRVQQWMTQLGFKEVKSFVRPEARGLLGKARGLLGSGCDEYIYVRT